MSSVVLNKAGPRIIDFYLSDSHLKIIVNGPGMLYEKLELMTNKTVLEGASVDFYRKVAEGLRATIACPHEPKRVAQISVEPHRIGAELSIELGSPSMYQSLLEIRTVGGETFKELIDASLSTDETPFSIRQPTIAALITVRATGHHEHHASAGAMIGSNPNPSGTTHHHPVGEYIQVKESDNEQ